jgi:hypothetical protein
MEKDLGELAAVELTVRLENAREERACRVLA